MAPWVDIWSASDKTSTATTAKAPKTKTDTAAGTATAGSGTKSQNHEHSQSSHQSSTISRARDGTSTTTGVEAHSIGLNPITTSANPYQTSGATSNLGSSGTSSPAPGGNVNGPNSRDNALTSGLSQGAKDGIIAGTVIGGTLIIALVLFALWRRRGRRHKQFEAPNEQPEAPRARPPSITTFLSAGTRDANLTALPIRKPKSALGKAGQLSLLRSSSSERLYKDNPSFTNLWKSANPPTPTNTQFPQNTTYKPGPSRLRPPEMAQVRGVDSQRPSIRISSYDDPDYFAVAESIHAPSTIDLEGASPLGSPNSQQALQDRWSQSASYMTSRSQMDVRSWRSSLSSLPGLRGMRDWIRIQSEKQRQLTRAREGQHVVPRRSSSVAFLKNKATKPNLAPGPTGELSVQRQSNVSTVGRPSWDIENIEDLESAVPVDGVIS